MMPLVLRQINYSKLTMALHGSWKSCQTPAGSQQNHLPSSCGKSGKRRRRRRRRRKQEVFVSLTDAQEISKCFLFKKTAFSQDQRTVLKNFLSGQHVFALLSTAFGESLVEHFGASQQLMPPVTLTGSLELPKPEVKNVIGPLECNRWNVCPIMFQVLPHPFKCFLWALY